MKKRNILSVILAVLPILVYGGLYQSLPEQIPSHFDFQGNVDDYMAKEHYWLLALLPLLMWVTFWVLPKIDPKKENYVKFGDFYQYFQFGMVVFMDLMFFLCLSSVYVEDTTYISRIVCLSVGVLFVVIGNYMPRIKPNFFMGIRTPWTISSEGVWLKTHRFGGKLFLLLGGLFFLFPLLTQTLAEMMVFPVIFLSLLPLPLSYVYYQQEQKKQGT